MKNTTLFYIVSLMLFFFVLLRFTEKNPDPTATQFIEWKMEQDSLMVLQKHTDSLIQLQVDSAYAILEDLNTQKSHSNAHTLTLKSRIESIKKQRTDYLNNLPK